MNHLVLELASNEPLDGKQRIGRVRDRLALCALADQDLPIIGVGHDGRRRAVALGILDDLGILAFQHRHAGVGGTQVDTDDLTHSSVLRCFDPAAPARSEPFT